MSENTFLIKELPLKQLQTDVNQPRTSYGVEGDENRLFSSMRKFGIQQALVVKKVDDELYTIIDGHRRYLCAQRLGLEKVPCRVHTSLSAGELSSVRFEVQNNKREWKPLEKAEALAQVKADNRFTTDKETAQHLHLAPSTVSSVMMVRSQNTNYIRLMEKYDLGETYRVEIGRTMSKVRKIKDIEPNDIILLLIEKIQRKVIKNAKDFRVLKRIFLRAKMNEEQIYRFLKEPMMNIAELGVITSQSNTTLLVEQLIAELGTRAQRGEKVLPQEKALYTELQELLAYLTKE